MPVNDDRDLIDLDKSQWSEGPPKRQPIFGPNWWYIPAFFAVVIVLTIMSGPDSAPWVRAIALALR